MKVLRILAYRLYGITIETPLDTMIIQGLIGCEESQEVTMAFRDLGHDFFSCDTQDCSGGHPEWHYKDDIFHVLMKDTLRYQFFGCHPPCTYLANSGVGRLVSIKEKPGFVWNEDRKIFVNTDRWEKMVDGAIFFRSLYANLQRIGHGYIENPIMHKYALEIIGVRHTQIIQPWQFGHPESKATCLWVYGLPELKPSEIAKAPRYREGKNGPVPIWDNQTESGQNKLAPGPERAKIRSKTYRGIAKAMADQWSSYMLKG